ncbi:hypothetical protein [Streptomyces sp. NPDC006355]|uniref:hypothetical protein n=1 Tax=Streptomyces sp. NPDC006355 TaxID=3156758 RepID=UPI0033A74E0F
MDELGTVLSSASVALIVTALTAHFVGRRGLGLGLTAGSAGLAVLSAVITDGSRIFAALNTAIFIWTVWHWWNGGGGDNTRRRLRRLARRFTGVRRTAPTTT